MKILYALQATGNGHVSRANALIPKLKKDVDVDVLISGTNSQLKTNFEFKHYKGISLFYTGNGSLDYLKMFQENKLTSFLRNVKKCQLDQYDLILNDFEPLTAWASKIRNLPHYAISHQWAVKHINSPKPQNQDPLAKIVLDKYAPSNDGLGFHFKAYHSSIHLPVLRQEILNGKSAYESFYLVYLPSYHHEQLIQFFKHFPHINFIIFSPSIKTNLNINNLEILPIDGDFFIKKLLTCEGVICNAGFELPSEALYLKKKLFVIPIAKQYEQLCNYTALKKIGVDGSLNLDREEVDLWLKKNLITKYSWEDQTDEVIKKVLERLAKT